MAVDRDYEDGAAETAGRRVPVEDAVKEHQDRSAPKAGDAGDAGESADAVAGDRGAARSAASLVPDTEKFALKTPDRFKEKLAKAIAAEPDKPVEELCREIHDGIRYTILLDVDNYADGVLAACGKLRDRGYEPLVLKNSRDDEEYKGVNSRWLDETSGLPFEVRFHTPESWMAKQQTHEVYEKMNDLRTPATERERLRAHQREVSREIHMPGGWQEIHEYRNDGW